MRYQFHRTRGGKVVWRLVGPNNRILGVSPESFPGVEAAAAAAQIVRNLVASGSVVSVVVVRDVSRRWRWSIADAELGVLAVAAHGYERRTACEAAIQRFTESAATAVIDQNLGRRGRFWRPDSE